MIHGSTFSGIGGFDYAAQNMGWENAFHCEWNEFCQRILKYYWPNATSYSDIKQTDFSIWRGRIDILTGGFPCQPFSTAGKRKGTGDDRYLWPEMLRAIREIQPKWIVGENVLGIVNWDGGMVFEQVCADLEAEGYKVQPYVLPVAGINGIIERYRCWFVAHSCKIELHATFSENSANISGRGEFQEEWSKNWDQFKLGPSPGYSERGFSWQDVFEPTVISRTDGLPLELDGITLSGWLDETLGAYGNAISPPLALQIFKAIEQYNSLTQAILKG